MADTSDNDLLAKARALVVSLERGDRSRAEAIIEDLTAEQESHLFLEVGRLTRELHEAINGFLLDERIVELAKRDIPDAGKRLNYVVEMTEKAAHTTLGAVEVGLPYVEELGREASDLAQGWADFRARRLSGEDLRSLSDRIAVFLDFASKGADDLHGSLSKVLMAQDYQDLTGQIISKVIQLVHDLEEKLVVLIRISGDRRQSLAAAESDPRSLAGPAVPGVDQRDLVQGQDDVDELLSSLGF